MNHMEESTLDTIQYSEMEVQSKSKETQSPVVHFAPKVPQTVSLADLIKDIRFIKKDDSYEIIFDKPLTIKVNGQLEIIGNEIHLDAVSFDLQKNGNIYLNSRQGSALKDFPESKLYRQHCKTSS